MTTIATRGDDLELSEMHWTQQDDPTGPRIELLHISQWSAETVDLHHVRRDDLRAAAAELDRLYLETLDPIEGACDSTLSSCAPSMGRDVDRTMR